MKRMKFTFGLTLSLLLMGASLNSALAQVPNNVPIYFKITGSPYWTGSNAVGITHGSYEYDKNTQTDSPVSISTNNYSVSAVPTITLSGGTGGVLNDAYSKGYHYDVVFELNYSYSDGKDIIPFVKRHIKVADDNGWTVSELILAPYTKQYDRTDWTDCTGVSTYVYRTNITEIVNKYKIVSITYEIWLGNMFGPNFSGAGNGNIYPVKSFYVASDESTIQLENGLYKGQLYWYRALEDLPLIVKGKAGEELVVSLSEKDTEGNLIWYSAADNKGKVVIEGEDGIWNVYVKKIATDYTPTYPIILGYKSNVSSQSQGQLNPVADHVWGAGGVLNVTSSQPAVLSVYSITGQLTKQATVAGDAKLTLPKGLYIVKLGDKAYKVVL